MHVLYKILKNYWGTLAVLLGVFIVWILITDSARVLNPVLFPTPMQVILAFFSKWNMLLQGFVSSMGLLLTGYLSGLFTGVTGGVFFGMRPGVRKVLLPIFHGLSPLPPTLFTPYAIALLPTFWSASVFLIFAGTFWPIFFGTLRGVVLMERVYMDNAMALGLKGRRLIWKVILPAASPLIFSGASVSLVFSFVLLTVAEMFGTRSGMGWFVQYYTDFSDYKYVQAGIIFNSVVIFGVMLIFEYIQRRCLFWKNLSFEENKN